MKVGYMIKIFRKVGNYEDWEDYQNLPKDGNYEGWEKDQTLPKGQ